MLSYLFARKRVSYTSEILAEYAHKNTTTQRLNERMRMRNNFIENRYYTALGQFH